jgi:nucleotide-binding universal stress UspA family protein
MALLAAGIVVFRFALPGNVPLVLIGSGLTGLALGATVAPALFVAGFSLQSASLQRVFAIIELLRAVAAFMVAPILAHVADALPGDLAAGTGMTLLIGLGLSIGGALFGVAIYVLSGARPQKPDLDEFLDGESPAWYSPPLLARLRGVSSSVAVRGRAEPRPVRVHGQVLFAYDGTELAGNAIRCAATQLGPGRCALVVCVWQPADVGFTPADGEHFDADQAKEVRRAVERTAAHGAWLAVRAGFEAESIAVEAAPTWQGIVRAADEHGASLIVLGPHRRSGLLGHLQGSVAAAVIAHSDIPVMVFPERSDSLLTRELAALPRASRSAAVALKDPLAEYERHEGQE